MAISARRGSLRAAAAVLVLSCVLSPAAYAAAPASSAPVRAPTEPAAASPPSPPGPIPVPLVISGSEDALATLARLEERTREDAQLERVARALPEEDRVVARIRAAATVDPRSTSADRALAHLEPEISRAGERLASLDDAMTGRARDFQSGSAELDRLRAIWSATATAPAMAEAPERVRARTAEVGARIEAAERTRTVYLVRLVELQDRLASVRAGLALASAEVARERRAEERLLFEAESAPLWRAVRSVPSADRASRARATARGHAKVLQEYFGAREAAAGWQLAFLVAVAAGLSLLRRAPGATARDQLVLRHPLHAAAVIVLGLTPVLQPAAPAPLFDLAFLAALVPWLVVSRPLVPRHLAKAHHALIALVALDRVTAFAPAYALSARLLLLGTSVAAVALLAKGLRRGGWSSALGDRWGQSRHAALWVALALLSLAVVTNVFGNVTLAARLTRGTLTSALTALLATGAIHVAQAAIGAVFRLPSLQGYRIVALDAAAVERRFTQAARWAALAAWFWAAALAFRVTTQVSAGAAAVIGLRLKVGNLDVSVGDVLAFAVTLWIAVTLARLVRFLLDEAVLPALALSRGLPGAISKTAQYGVVILGAFAAIYASGMELSRFSLFAGTLGVGIGFGLQNVVNNFISGLILLYERPVQPGDIIEVGTVTGEVRRIGIRSSTVRTFQGADVIVPNGTLIAAEVVNWTLSDRSRRADVTVSVAYGSDPVAVRQILLAAVDRKDVLREPAPLVLLTRFGDSALEFELRFWPEQIDTWVVIASEVRETILRELGKAGIAIPFPQRDLHVRTGPPASVDLSDLARALPANPAVKPPRKTP